MSVSRRIALAVILKSLANTGFKRPVERVVMAVQMRLLLVDRGSPVVLRVAAIRTV